MPIGYEIVSEMPQVRVVGEGNVSMSEMLSAFDQVALDPLFSPQFTITFDLRAASYEAELTDGNALAAVLKEKRSNFQNRLALVVPQPLQLLATLYCALVTVGGFDKIQAFTDLEQAEAWCRMET